MRKQAPSHNAGVSPRSGHFPLHQSRLSPPHKERSVALPASGSHSVIQRKKKEGDKKIKNRVLRNEGMERGAGEREVERPQRLWVVHSAERQDGLGKIHTAGCFFFAAAAVKDIGPQRGQGSEDVTLLLQTPIRPWEEAGRCGPVLNLLSMSDSLLNIQTYLKQGSITVSQVLYETKVADRVVFGELIWLWFVCGPPAVFCCSSNI